MSLTRTANAKWRSIDPIVRALIFSVLIHLIICGALLLAALLGISQLVFFNLLKNDKLVPVQLVATPPPQQEREIELSFIEVDPSKIVEAPKDAKFYGAINAEAANVKIEKDTDTPQIEGTRKEANKLTDNSRPKPQPLQPTPTPPDQIEREEKAPEKPKEAPPEGDLELAKIEDKPRKETEKKPDVKEGRQEQPRQKRPRTIAEAKAAANPGEKMKQDGGVKRYDLSGSLNVKGSIVGGYDQRFIEAVRQCWYDMLDDTSATQPGSVRLEFRINYKGQISQMRVAETTVGQLQTVICEQAIQKPSPYGEWPREMRIELKGDYRDVTFTFTYH